MQSIAQKPQFNCTKHLNGTWHAQCLYYVFESLWVEPFESIWVEPPQYRDDLEFAFWIGKGDVLGNKLYYFDDCNVL